MTECQILETSIGMLVYKIPRPIECFHDSKSSSDRAALLIVFNV